MSEQSDHRAEAEKLLRAMSEVKDQYIEDAAGDGFRKDKSGLSTQRIRRVRQWIGIAAAACLFAAVIGRWIFVMNRPSMLTSGSYAAESENTEDTEGITAPETMEEAAGESEAGRDNGTGKAAEADADTGTDSETEETAEADAEAADTLANPYVEVESLSEAAAITGFALQVPDAEEPYTSMVIDVIDGTMIQVSYFNTDETEEGYYIRKAAGEEDISGDYNDYTDIVTEEVDGMSVTLKGNGGTWSVAIWSADGYTYAIGAQGHPLTGEQMLNRIRKTG